MRVLAGFALCLCVAGVPGLAAAGEALVVKLSIDLAGGAVTGSAGAETAIKVRRPPLDGAEDPLSGYIGPDSALLPPDAGWLPPLPAGHDRWRLVVTTPPGSMAVPYPDGVVAALPGGGAETTFELRPEIARAPLIVGPYQMTERVLNGVAIRTFFTGANAGLADAYIEAAGAAVAALGERIGAYPYKAFAVVETPLPVGLGFPGFTLASGRILPQPFMRGRSLWHEIAHVWWGNGVFVDYRNGNWAEGFATYFADYALAEAEGPEAARAMRYDWLLEYDALPQSRRTPLRAFVTKRHGQAQAVGYGKAAMLLAMLRDRIGAPAFNVGIRRFWTDNRFTSAGWPAIEAAFSAAAGQDLSAFFAHWLDRPDALPASPDDPDFRTFRQLQPDERIQTLRLALQADSLTPQIIGESVIEPQALADALGPLGAIGPAGMPVLIGARAEFFKRGIAVPPDAGAAIWVAAGQDGRDILAVAASDAATVQALASRARHYGRWSWLALEADGRPMRGRWPSP